MRAVLLFAQPSAREARRKGLPGAERLFDLLRRRTVTAALSLDGADLVVIGNPGPVWLPGSVQVVPQRGRSFAERLANAFADIRALGYDEVVAVGADSPGLSKSHLEGAFAALQSQDAVFGPASDGGVYLIGCRGDASSLLQGVQWRTGRVLAQLLERCPGAGLLADSLADVDGRSDLPFLLGDPELAVLIGRLLERRPVALPGASSRPRWRSSFPADPRGPPCASPVVS